METFGPEPADSARSADLLERLVDRPIRKNLAAALNRSSMTSKQMYALLGVVQQVVSMGVPLTPAIFRKARAMARKLLKNKRFWSCLGAQADYGMLQAMEQWLGRQIPGRGAGRAPLLAEQFQAPPPQAQQPQTVPARHARATARPLPAAARQPAPRRAPASAVVEDDGDDFELGALRPHRAAPPAARAAAPYAGPMSDENFDLGPLQHREQAAEDEDDDERRVSWGARD